MSTDREATRGRCHRKENACHSGKNQQYYLQSILTREHSRMENFKESSYPRGSEWRRWDLHIHTPSSKLGTSFPGMDWEEYVTALEAAALANDIAVVGITDYMSIDGYEKALESKVHPTNPRFGSVALLIPNIELRVLPATKDSKALNVHVLVDPTAPDQVDRIKRAMRQLRVKYNGETYGCCRDELN